MARQTVREYIKWKIAYYKDIAKANEGKPERYAVRKLALRLKRENEAILARLEAETKWKN